MTTLSNKAETKKVNIIANGFTDCRAFFVQVYNNEESVIEAKSFPTKEKAIIWATKKLS